jgi:hypothetical protein
VAPSSLMALTPMATRCVPSPTPPFFGQIRGLLVRSRGIADLSAGGAKPRRFHFRSCRRLCPLDSCERAQGSTWNYGSNFGGGTGSPTVHSDTSASGGMFGSWGVVDTTYSAIDDTTKAVTGMNTKITLCPGTSGATCSG